MLGNVILKNIFMFLVFRIPASGNVYFYFWSPCVACGVLVP